MEDKLKKLANYIANINKEVADKIISLSGRYDKIYTPLPPKLQPALHYVVYLQLKGLDDSSFFQLKRKYLNTSNKIQEECRKELEKLIHKDSIESGIPTSEIRRKLMQEVSRFSS